MATGSAQDTDGASSEKSGGGISIFFVAAGLCFVLALGVMGVWYNAGGHFVTQYSVMETVVEIDPDFGDEIERTVERDEFRFGLMPDKGYDGAAPLAGGLVVLAIGLVVVGVVRRRKEK